jgi:4-hydroxy-3-methylbut-2-enyl diphosphate reductase
MEVKLASNYGFCFGVKRAIKIAEEHQNSSTMGPLIHNQDEINRLKNSFNVGLYSNLSDVKQNDTVIIRTHGIPKNDLKNLKALDAKIINATCPFVTTPQQIVKKMSSEGYSILIFGDAELKELYKVEKPRVVAKYELRNILVTYEENADKIINALNKAKTKKEKQESFIKYVKSVSNDLASKQKDGLTDLVDANKLNAEIKTALKDKNEGDIVNLKDVGTQIIFIERYIPEKEASFQESEEALINLAKRKALVKEMDLLLK